MNRRTQSKGYEFDGEVTVVCGRGWIELSVFLKGHLDLSAETQRALEGHWRRCAQCGRGRGHNPVRGVGPFGLSLRIRPKDEEHWAEVLVDLAAKPGALVPHDVYLAELRERKRLR